MFFILIVSFSWNFKAHTGNMRNFFSFIREKNSKKGRTTAFQHLSCPDY